MLPLGKMRPRPDPQKSQNGWAVQKQRLSVLETFVQNMANALFKKSCTPALTHTNKKWTGCPETEVFSSGALP